MEAMWRVVPWQADCSGVRWRDNIAVQSFGGMAMRLKSQVFLVTASVFVLAATAARADVTISSDATANMSCAAGVCVPTASDAVLNVGDLQTMLAAGNVTVMTTGSGVQANNIAVASSLGWSANTLTLDAFQSISVTAPITVKGKNGLSILTNDGGSGGELAFFGKGHVTFKKLSGKLAINGTNYTLVNSIASLAAAITKNAFGNYALGGDYNAAKDGTFGDSPIKMAYQGSFEGLGNTISNFSILVPYATKGQMIGLFAETTGSISDIALAKVKIEIVKIEHHRNMIPAFVGVLAGINEGLITRSCTNGKISSPGYTEAGGLVGESDGTIAESCSVASLKTGVNVPTDYSDAGGLVGFNGGMIKLSYAGGPVAATEYSGGIVGISEGQIMNVYSTGKVSGNSENVSGGVVGYNVDKDSVTIINSYSTGEVSGFLIGGLIGADQSPLGNLSNTYWDMNTSGVTNPDQGAGSPLNDPGITGLTTKQLKSGLPTGFDPFVWGENAKINNGLPYLITNPPR
jgi:hypothetical protein